MFALRSGRLSSSVLRSSVYAPKVWAPTRRFCSETESDKEGKKEKPAKKKYDYWKLGFIDIIRNPMENKEFFYYPKDPSEIENHKVCVVYDRKPKAKQHLLVLPTMLLQQYKQLNETHIPLLEEMKDRANKVVEEFVAFKKKKKFQ